MSVVTFRAFLLCTVVLLGNGCSILNKPDESLLDASVDSGSPDAFDGGSDAWDGGYDAGDACVPVRELCGDGKDNDCDTLTDCSDFDCASAVAQCCREGSPLLNHDWSGSNPFARWSAIPEGTELPGRHLDGGIQRFEPGFVSGIISNSCQPLALGMELSIEFTLQSAGTCTEDCFARLVFTPAATSVSGEVPSDLAVEVNYDAMQVRVTQAGRNIGSTFAAGLDQRITVQVFLSPGLDARDEPAMVAKVVAERSGLAETLVDDFTFLAQADLEDRLAGCDETPGLFLGIEGRGDRVRVGTLLSQTKECVNPGQFNPPEDDSATLSRTHVGTGTWAEGGLGSPSLVSSSPGVGVVSWDLFFDATNVPRDLQTFDVGFAIGHVRTEDWDVTPWPGGAEPRAGDNPPECLGMAGCSANRSHREPSLLAGSAGSLDVVFARQVEAEVLAGNRNIFEIWVDWSIPRNLTSSFTGATLLFPAEVGCLSLRDPVLVDRGDGDHWLFFTCEHEGLPSQIHMVGVKHGTHEMETASHRPAVGPGLGSFAANGVQAPEVIVDFDPVEDGAVYRMWFLAMDRSQERSIAMAQAQVSSPGEEPHFVAYPANPVLRADDRILGACGIDCALEGLATTRHALEEQTLRFLVARRMQSSGDAVEYQLVPLEQFWRSPWSGI